MKAEGRNGLFSIIVVRFRGFPLQSDRIQGLFLMAGFSLRSEGGEKCVTCCIIVYFFSGGDILFRWLEFY